MDDYDVIYLDEDERNAAPLVEPMSDAKVGACAPLMFEMERPHVVDAAGLKVDEFAAQLSFFFNAHNQFLEEVAKLMAEGSTKVAGVAK